MAVYYKFKSAKDFDSIPIDGHFISVENLKERIFESKHLGRGTDFDLVVTNAQTNEEYLDEAMLIPKNTSILIRRVPGRPRMPIVSQPDESKMESKPEDDQLLKNNFTAPESSVFNDLGTSEWDDEFGNDLYATIPDVTPVQSSNMVQDAPAPSEADEDSKIKALIETPALDWQRQAANGFGTGRGYGRAGRAIGGRGFGRGGLAKTPPQGYVCHRCRQPGHFIQHCPTNGDPNFDIKKIKQPTGIPKSMLMATPDGSYALPSGDVAVLRPNEAAFEKEIEGLPSTRSVGDLPPELHCPLCKQVMKDAVLTSKCCFKSFCDKCIRDCIISKSMCVCGAVDVLADDLLPNKTLRDTINRILESNNNSSADNAGSAYQVQDMESARCPQPKMPSPSQSAASKGDHMPPPHAEQAPKAMETVAEHQPLNPRQQEMQPQTKMQTNKVPAVSEATHESASAREPASLSSAQPVEEEVQQKLAAGEPAKPKKKKKKARVPGAPDMQWRPNQEFPVDNNFMTPMGPSAYNPYWGGMQPGMDSFMGPYGGGGMPYNMGFGPGPMDIPFMPPHDPFGLPQNFTFPPMVPPQRDLAEMSMGPMGMNMGNMGMNMPMNMGMNVRPPLMSREEFEARKADLRRKRESDRRVESRELPRDRDYGREVSSNVDGPSMKPKPKPVPRSPSADRYDDYERERIRERERARSRDREESHHRHRSSSHRPERNSPDKSSRDPELPRPSSKRKSEHNRCYEDDYDYERERDKERERERRHQHHRSEVPSTKQVAVSSEPPAPLPASSKSSSTAANAADAAAAERERKKASVFSRISFPEGESSKKRKVSSSSSEVKSSNTKNQDSGGSGHRHHSNKSSSAAIVNGYHKSSRSELDYESSDDDRHFKRKPSRYEPSPPPPMAVEEQLSSRHSKGSRERERVRSSHGKHR